jgi:hypothetical protein
MKKQKPLTDESGEVRELTIEDMKAFRPIGDVIPPSLAAKLGLKERKKISATRPRRESNRRPTERRRSSA